jgi:nitrite reductase/ring-hydroxylating ferredoxin subunit
LARHVVGTLEDFPEGTSKIVAVKGREIGVYNIKGEFFAVYNWCPHGGAALCKGPLVSRCKSDRPGHYELERKGEMLRCPWHGWEYDIRTGQSWCDPNDMKARTYKIQVEPGETLAKGPYVAETAPVTVDGKYVVLDV